MGVTLGGGVAQTGTFAAPTTHWQTSPMMPQSWPMAAPIFRSGKPCGQEKFNSDASTPVSWQRTSISTQASLLYSSMIEQMRMPSGYLYLTCLNSSIQVINERSEMSSMFCQP